MKQEVTIDENEVNQAILDYAEKHGVKLENVATKVTVVAGRGDRGVYATIAIEPNNTVLKYNKISAEGKLTPVNTPEESLPEVRSIQDDIDEGVPVEFTQEVNDDDEIFG